MYIWFVHQGKNLAVVEIYQGKCCREMAFSKSSTILQKQNLILPSTILLASASELNPANTTLQNNEKNILTLIHPSTSSQCSILLIILYLLLQALKCCLSTKVTDLYRGGYWWQTSTMK